MMSLYVRNNELLPCGRLSAAYTGVIRKGEGMFSNRYYEFRAAILQALFLILALSAGGCSDDPARPEPEDPSLAVQLERLVEVRGIPGALGIVMQDGAIIDAGARGVRRAGEPDTIATGDLIHIGSITKSMTATMIAILVDEGSLSWDTKPADVIPGLSGLVHPGYAESTLLDLLRHRAAIPADEDFASIPGFTGTLPEQRVKASLWCLQQASPVARGTYRYSNAGYVIAACMAESVTGTGWRELMDSRVFGPLGMEAFYGWPTEHDAAQPSGHEPAGSAYSPVEPAIEPDSLDFIEPAGFVSMTMEDLAAFMKLHIDALQGNPRLVSGEGFGILHAPVGDYGCGLGIVQTNKGMLYWHNGSNTYFFAVMYILPEHNVAVAIAVNAGGDEAGLMTHTAAETVLLGLLDQVATAGKNFEGNKACILQGNQRGN